MFSNFNYKKLNENKYKLKINDIDGKLVNKTNPT